MTATAKSRAALVETAGAYFYQGHTPTWAEFQDLMQSFLNLVDDRTDAIEADDATQAVWASVYADLPDPPAGMSNNSLSQLLNRIASAQTNLLVDRSADIATNTTDIATNKTNITNLDMRVTVNAFNISAVQATAGAALPKAGGTMTGDLALGGNDISGIQTAVFVQEYHNGNSGSAFTVDFANGQNQGITLSDNATLTLADPPGVGHYQLAVHQDSTGGHTVTWSGIAETSWLGSASWPSINTVPYGTTMINLFWDGTIWYGSGSKVGAT